MSALSGAGAPLSEGNYRFTAAIATTANERGVRALRGGGAVFAHHGLISPSIAPHVSMVVDPAGVRVLAQGLLERGWRLVPMAQRRLLPPAIVALAAPRDEVFAHLHGIIPGFVVDPADVFDDLWDARDELVIGGVHVPVLDRRSTMVFAMHHRLGGQAMPRSRPGNIEFFTRQFDSALKTADRAALLAFVRRLGAQHEVRDLLAALSLGQHGGAPTVSRAYVAGRLALAEPGDADVALLARLERGGWAGVPPSRPPALAGAMVRMLDARRRVAARDRPMVR